MKFLPFVLTITGVVAGQSAPPRKDIPAIAKAANGAIVSIVMSDKDGKPIAQGSGFLVSKDGVIVTNYHVISEGSSAIVKFPDGAFYVVDGVLASDKARDVAVIKAHGESFRTLMLGNSDQIQVGEEVVAIGNPLSLESTVSNGIVSGIRTDEKRGGKFLQVTAPISPGSSGGPLFNMFGEVVGITTLYLEGGENLNFAIPINDAKRLLHVNSSQLQALPNETEPVNAQIHDADTPSSSNGQSASLMSSDTLEETISWMTAFVNEHGQSPGDDASTGTANIGISTKSYREAYRAVVGSDLSGKDSCGVFVQHKRRTEEWVVLMSLADIDPANIRAFTGPMVQFVTSHDFNKIVTLRYAGGKVVPLAAWSTGNIVFDSAENADVFAYALKHAVSLCGATTTRETLP